MAYDAANHRFILGSLPSGALGQVLDNGTYTAFADDAQLVSTTGIFIDAPRNRVLTAVGDLAGNSARTSSATQYKLAALASYDRSTGRRLTHVNLGALRPNLSHLANGIAVDAQGNAYVTDSFAPIIYQVDAQGTASIFLEDNRLSAPAGNFGLNGIVLHPDGYLLVAKYDDGTLCKVPLANPGTFTKITTTAVPSADGLLLADNNTLLVASNGIGTKTNTVFQVRTSDNWASAATAKSVATGDVFPTALTRRDADVYVLQSYVGALLAGQNPPVAQFGIQKLKL